MCLIPTACWTENASGQSRPAPLRILFCKYEYNRNLFGDAQQRSTSIFVCYWNSFD